MVDSSRRSSIHRRSSADSGVDVEPVMLKRESSIKDNRLCPPEIHTRPPRVTLSATLTRDNDVITSVVTSNTADQKTLPASQSLAVSSVIKEDISPYNKSTSDNYINRISDVPKAAVIPQTVPEKHNTTFNKSNETSPTHISLSKYLGNIIFRTLDCHTSKNEDDTESHDHEKNPGLCRNKNPGSLRNKHPIPVILVTQISQDNLFAENVPPVQL